MAAQAMVEEVGYGFADASHEEECNRFLRTRLCVLLLLLLSLDCSCVMQPSGGLYSFVYRIFEAGVVLQEIGVSWRRARTVHNSFNDMRNDYDREP